MFSRPECINLQETTFSVRILSFVFYFGCLSHIVAELTLSTSGVCNLIVEFSLQLLPLGALKDSLILERYPCYFLFPVH